MGEGFNYSITNQFETNIRFKELCVYLLSRFYPFTKDQVINYRNILNFDYSGIMSNQNIKWDLDLVDLLKDEIDWSGFWKSQGLELDLNFFKNYKEYVDFSNIHLNKNIDWSNQLLDTYQDEWNWKSLSLQKIIANHRNIKLYENRLDWSYLSSNRHLEIDEILLDNFQNKWHWKKLCNNSAAKFNKDYISKYYDLIDWNALSRNSSMVSFILAHTNHYPWDWKTFIQNRGLVFSDSITRFLTDKLKKDFSKFRSLSDEQRKRMALKKLIIIQSKSGFFDKEYFFKDEFEKIIPYEHLLITNPKSLTTNKIEKYLDTNNLDIIFKSELITKLSKKYIEEHLELFYKFSWNIFRHGKINASFVYNHAKENEWYQLAFNEQFSWNLAFLISNFERFKTNYGLKQNKRLYIELFESLNSDDINKLLNKY